MDKRDIQDVVRGGSEWFKAIGGGGGGGGGLGQKFIYFLVSIYLFSKFILLSPPLYRIPKIFTIGPKSGNTGLPQTQGNQRNQGKPSHILENSGNFNFSQGNQGKKFFPSKKKS